MIQKRKYEFQTQSHPDWNSSSSINNYVILSQVQHSRVKKIKIYAKSQHRIRENSDNTIIISNQLVAESAFQLRFATQTFSLCPWWYFFGPRQQKSLQEIPQFMTPSLKRKNTILYKIILCKNFFKSHNEQCCNVNLFPPSRNQQYDSVISVYKIQSKLITYLKCFNSPKKQQPGLTCSRIFIYSPQQPQLHIRPFANKDCTLWSIKLSSVIYNTLRKKQNVNRLQNICNKSLYP